ncbi:MAG: hypothetical protein LBR08_08370 [Bacteroidales bacterium]|jgi:hypothetical protein|nr:hypothetical protein [Bacteroidales bacterium]
MMKVSINFILVIAGLCLRFAPDAAARDYYVSASAGSNGNGSVSSPASLTTLQSFLSAYIVDLNDADTRQLNIYFEGGTYKVPEGGFRIGRDGTPEDRSGLNVFFLPVPNATVILTGSPKSYYTSKFLHMANSLSKERSLNVTVENMTVKNFISSLTMEYAIGDASLFTVLANNTLNLNHVSIDNIISAQNPFVSVGTDATVNVNNSTITEIYRSGMNTRSICTPADKARNCTLNFTNCTLAKWSMNTYSKEPHVFHFYHDNARFILRNCIVRDYDVLNSFLYVDHSNSHVELENTVFNNNWSQSSTSIIFICNRRGNMEITDCRFSGNLLRSQGSMLLGSYNGKFEMTGSTFFNNSIYSNTAINYLYFDKNGEALLVNNTFSNNTVSAVGTAAPTPQMYCIRTEKENGGIINNTLVESGGIIVDGANDKPNLHIVNNLVTHRTSYKLTEDISGKANIRRNIFSGKFVPSGTGGGSNIYDLLSYIRDAEPYKPGKLEVHPLVLNKGSNPILGKGGKASDMPYGDYVVYDQRGMKRPENISIGSWDLPDFAAHNSWYTIFYDPAKGLAGYYDVDLSQYISTYPDGATPSNVTFEIVTQPANGTFASTNINQTYRFTPKTDPNDRTKPAVGVVDIPSDFAYKISFVQAGIQFHHIIHLMVVIRNMHRPMGVMDENSLRCFTNMKQDKFVPQYKFISSGVNDATHKYDAFSTPLVGDLNGDHKPEIVTLGFADTPTGQASLFGVASYIVILNGQTGKEIVRYPLPAQWRVREPTHNTPSWMALVDVDRNGQAEIIVAFGYTEWGKNIVKYNKQVVCYGVNAETFLPASTGFPADHPNRLTEKWVSTVRYDQSKLGVANWNSMKTSPLPQIADINEDGIPEIIVYNKIYNALTGDLMITLEDLEPNTSWNNTGASIAQYRNYAYVGRNRHTTYDSGTASDRHINFSCIYDLNGDGQMEIIAGGKVYHNLNTKNGSYSVKSADGSAANLGVGDGYTAVADINADGKAEIIVVSYADNTQKNLRITVWDPGFMESNGAGGWKPVASPDVSPMKILADVRVPIAFNGRGGTHSYISVGDIDGKTDAAGKKYPEISILGPRFYDKQTIPNHPNVPGLSGFGSYSAEARGSLMSWTWNETATTPAERLKVSFLMEHTVRSLNTACTLFDFNNDGLLDICFRDEQAVRVITAKKPFIRLSDESMTLFHASVSGNNRMRTGYEYPVVADVNGDASADIIIVGSSLNDDTRGYVHVLQTALSHARFAPAPKVWNQFMYSPLKILEDLEIPVKNNHPLSANLTYLLDRDVASGAKTHIYNNVTAQVPAYVLYRTVNASGNAIEAIKMVLPLPDAVISDLRINKSLSRLEFTVSNSGDASLASNLPIAIFMGTDQYVPSGYKGKVRLKEDLFTGESVRFTYPLGQQELTKNFTVRVADSTCNNTTDLFTKYFDDCNRSDNVMDVGDFIVRPDVVTILHRETATVDVLANDLLPANCNFTLSANAIETPAGTGVLQGSFGSVRIAGNRLVYTAPEHTPGNIVEIRYRVTCGNEVRSNKVYIFVGESCQQGFSVCRGTSYRLCLLSKPAGVRFEWYNKDRVFLGNTAPFLPSVSGNETFFFRPVMPQGAYELISFPLAPVVIRLIPPGITFKWTGNADTDWHNPMNWMIDNNGKAEIAAFPPVNCSDVFIDKGLNNYPELRQRAYCNNIRLAPHAMIAGIHHLEYRNAEVDVAVEPKDRDKFVMLSAPLKDTYTGDYYLNVTGNTILRGDVYMNFFQTGNPDYQGSKSKENIFTSTFGKLDIPLPLGKPFNLKIVATSNNRDKLFGFPRKATQYAYNDGSRTSTLSRAQSGRFITDGAMDVNTGDLLLPVDGNNNYSLIQLVNPFMAYLKVEAFLAANAGVLEQGYKVWDGDVHGNFITILYPDAAHEDRLQIALTDRDMADKNMSAARIAPLHSFFVMKSAKQPVTSLKMSSAMTTTQLPAPVVKKMSTDERQILRIRASGKETSNTTIVRHHPGAYAGYDSREDSRKLFNSEAYVAVYTFTPDMADPLAINSVGSLSDDIPLGLVLRNTDKVRLDFPNMEQFGSPVWLIDHELGKRVNLRNNPVYTFTVRQPAVPGVVELNNRFSLSFVDKDAASPPADEKKAEASEEQDVIVTVEEGNVIHVYSKSSVKIMSAQVYDVTGKMWFGSSAPARSYRIPVPAGRLYLLRVNIGGTTKTVKVVVR